MSQTTYLTLAETLWLQTKNRRVLYSIVLAVLGSLLLTASAKIQIPFYPVPQTMQTFVVLVLGMLYGWRLGAATVLLYLAQGALGFPVFAGTPVKGIGIAYMLGTTGGYLLGFVFAAAICGWLAERGWDRGVFTTAIAMLIGSVVIYIFGLTWLSSFIGMEKAIQFGLTPFLFGDIAKLILAAITLPLVWAALKGKSPSGR